VTPGGDPGGRQAPGSSGPLTHAFLPGEDAEAPLLLLLHGTGGDERDLLPLGRLLWPGAPVLSPRGPVVEGDGMPRFFRRIPADPAGGEVSPAYPFTFDDGDVAENVDRVADLVTWAQDEYDLGRRPVLASGFSNGANLAGAMLLLRPAVLRAAALFAPMPVLSAPPAADLSATVVLLCGGRHDPIATPEHLETLAGWLTDRGAAVEVAFHDGGHELPRGAVEAARDWLTKVRAALGVDAGGLP
jgi:phospholipase/carboxylesterase